MELSPNNSVAAVYWNCKDFGHGWVVICSILLWTFMTTRWWLYWACSARQVVVIVWTCCWRLLKAGTVSFSANCFSSHPKPNFLSHPWLLSCITLPFFLPPSSCSYWQFFWNKIQIFVQKEKKCCTYLFSFFRCLFPFIYRLPQIW